ncbi:MAG: DUF3368 domain-containing protein [Verrucomicrobia bacterium]|nr:DUF3368 domain-containing protein [Verrucomicrobiota bacterium]
MPVVSNTSPICNLAVIGRLDILHARFGVIMIPRAVRDELDRLAHADGRRAIKNACAEGWLRVEEVTRRELVDVLASSLDAGESEAIALAWEVKAGMLVMDESAGRTMARHLGVNLTGTLGVLLKEVRAGRLASMREEIDRLVEDAGFFVSHRVRQTFLDAAGER